VTYRITVLGTGYLGATHAACMAELGYEVLGVDVDHAKVTALSEGRVPFFEPELEPLLRKHVESGRLRFTTSYEEAADFGDVHFICVGTPQRDGEYAADMSYIDATIESLVPKLTRPALIVGKSTVPVGSSSWPPVPPSSWPGARSSPARAWPSRTPCAPTAWCSASPAPMPRRCSARCSRR
jgi:UDPglucose 6-dehydrogenase